MKQKAVSRITPKVFPPDPSGLCIYCGEEPTGILSREHIVPVGFGGGLILLSASCEKCRRKTEAFETTCLRKSFFPYRYHFGFIRHKREIPKTIPLVLLSPDKKLKHVSPEDHPNYLILPQIHTLPGIIEGRAPEIPFSLTYQFFGTNETEEFLTGAPGISFWEKGFNLRAFCRMLAKIAHSFAVAEIGLQCFNPMLTDYILGKGPDVGSYLIGSDTLRDVPVPKDAPLHQVGWAPLRFGSNYLVGVRIRLCLANGPTPAYMVIAGEISAATANHHLQQKGQ
jgi:hypothetical protein